MWTLKNGFLSDDEFPFQNFITTKSLGDMKSPSARAEACSLKGLDSMSVVYAEQVHGNTVAAVGLKERGKFVKSADGLVTSAPGVSLAIFTADCLPVLFGVKGKAAGVSHAGWRGLYKGILPETVRRFEKEFNAKPGEITVSIGPRICSGCYAVGGEVKAAFGLPATAEKFDLTAEAVKQLKGCGVKNIIASGNCTLHEPDIFFSHRKDKTAARIMSLVTFS